MEPIFILNGRRYRFHKPLGDGGARLEADDIDDWSTVDVSRETYERLVSEAAQRAAETS